MDKQKIILVGLWLMVGVFGRLIPHLPNMTPLTSLSILAGVVFSRRIALLIIAVTLLLSNLLLTVLFHYPFFGAWTIFTSSGFLLIVLASSYQLKTQQFANVLVFGVVAGAGYWLWTNFGVWLFSGFYEHTGSGLIACYTLALPFLQNSLLGVVVWLAVLLGGQCLLQKIFDRTANMSELPSLRDS